MQPLIDWAVQVFRHAPHEMITPEQLGNPGLLDPHKLYGCVVEEEHMVRPAVEGAEFSRSEYLGIRSTGGTRGIRVL